MENKVFDILVNFDKTDSISDDGIRIVQGDYNSIEFNFQLSKKDYSTAMFYMVKPSGLHYADNIKDDKVIFKDNTAFNEVGKYLFSVALYGSDSRLTNTAKGVLVVVDGKLDMDDEIVEQENYKILDSLINEVNSLKDDFEIGIEAVNTFFNNATYNAKDGVITFTRKDGTTVKIDLPLELIVKSGRYDSETKNLVLTLANEDVINIPVGELVDEYYADGTTIELKDVNGKLTFNVKNGVYQEKQTGKGLSTNDFTNDYKSNVDENTKNRHSHTNKSVLDSTTASFKTKDKTNLDSNTSARHTHSNKAVLDATTASFTTEMKNTISGLSKVATSGSYSDLSNKPTIPSVVDNLTSTSTSSSLSAKQGKVLNDKIESMNQMNYANAGFHNSIFRGADVTKYLTDGNLYTRISNGTFEDLYVGDYIIKNNITWRIVGFDVYYNKGDTAFTKHHAIIVPDTNLTTGRMNSTNTTVGGVAESEMYKTTLNDVLSNYITPVFGTHVLEYRQLLTTGINATGYNRFGNNGGCSNAWAWSSRKLDLMNEVQVYGSIVWSSSGYDIGSDNVQLPLFRLAPQYICNRAWYWLRTITTSSAFAVVDHYGYSTNGNASNSGGGIRPCFYID